MLNKREERPKLPADFHIFPCCLYLQSNKYTAQPAGLCISVPRGWFLSLFVACTQLEHTAEPEFPKGIINMPEKVTYLVIKTFKTTQITRNSSGVCVTREGKKSEENEKMSKDFMCFEM